MSWKCFFGFHKWVHGIMYCYYKHGSFTRKIRKCDKCEKMQQFKPRTICFRMNEHDYKWTTIK
jgi:hypothetical protein